MNVLVSERIREIQEIYNSISDTIITRLHEFKQLFEKENDERIFAELVFCLLTPQSKAHVCWKAVENLISKNLLLTGDRDQILLELNGVRFKYKKAGYIIEAREKFMKNGRIQIKSVITRFKDSREAREWFVKEIKGMGYKEASHFLRNIGMGENLAILDRHILKNLKLCGVIEEIPASMSGKKYKEIEEKMIEFAKKINIPVSHLDLVLWYKENGTVFK